MSSNFVIYIKRKQQSKCTHSASDFFCTFCWLRWFVSRENVKVSAVEIYIICCFLSCADPKTTQFIFFCWLATSFNNNVINRLLMTEEIIEDIWRSCVKLKSYKKSMRFPRMRVISGRLSKSIRAIKLTIVR